MMKRFCGICLALLLFICSASADSWSGSVTSLETVQIISPAEGILETLVIEPGAMVSEGAAVGSIRMEKVFAPFDGTIATVSVKEGGEASGTVLEISPVSMYTISCTVSDIAKTPENALVHIGETVYVRCTADGSHRAEAVIISVSGAEWTAETTAGELYVGEAVNLYRDAECTADRRIGKGTVTAHDPLAVSAEGVIRQLRVGTGDRVERGQWLFSVSSSTDNEVRIPASGIVTEVTDAVGVSVQENQVLGEIAISCVIRITVSPDEAGLFEPDQRWSYLRMDDPHETPHSCHVSRILVPVDGSAEIEFVPDDDLLLPVGMTVQIIDPQD